jgi:Protein of unknown function (DUF3800)
VAGGKMTAPLSLSGHPLEGDRIVRLVYVDEAGVSNRRQEPWLVVGAVVVDADKKLVAVERHLDKIVKRHIPEEHWGDFVFHATHLFMWGGKVFTKNNPDWPLHRRLEIADELAAIPKKFDLPLMHGLCEREKFPSDPRLREGRTEGEVTVAAHVSTYVACAVNVDQWMKKNTNGEVCLMVVEDNEQARSHIRNFQNYYQRGDFSEMIAEHKGIFPLKRIKEDPLFQGKRKTSILQLADFWAYVAKRSAMKDERYMRFFEPMLPLVYPSVRVIQHV